jgi:hypothetical protein
MRRLVQPSASHAGPSAPTPLLRRRLPPHRVSEATEPSRSPLPQPDLLHKLGIVPEQVLLIHDAFLVPATNDIWIL